MADYIGSGNITISGVVRYIYQDNYLLDFEPFSKNRLYESGLDENNKYPEDYIQNYADLFRSK